MPMKRLFPVEGMKMLAASRKFRNTLRGSMIDLLPTCFARFSTWRLPRPRGSDVGFNPTRSADRPMRSTQQFSITLPNEMADAVRAKVAGGEYATESEVIRDGLRVLLARDRVVEDWLRHDVAAAYDAMTADPQRSIGVERVKARLAAAAAKVMPKR